MGGDGAVGKSLESLRRTTLNVYPSLSSPERVVGCDLSLEGPSCTSRVREEDTTVLSVE